MIRSPWNLELKTQHEPLAIETSLNQAQPCGTPRRAWWREAEFALLLLLVSGIYFSRMTEPSIRGEESRRGRIAWEMIESGDWIVPRVQGEPLLSRPPLQNWAIAVVGLLRGQVDVMAVRLPSVLATLFTAMLLYGYARTFLSPFGALAAGLSYPTMGHVLELGRLGETEALFTCLVCASLLVWHWNYLKGRPAVRTWTAAYFFVGLATLAKGPQAPVYFSSAVGLYLLLTRQWRYALSWSHLAGIALFALIVGAWQVPCYLDLGWSGVAQLYYSDVALRFVDTRWTTFARHLVTFPLEIVGACLLPWSFLLLAFVRREFRNSVGNARPQVLFALIAIGSAFPSVWIAPSAVPRYFMPLYPCFALLAGLVADRCLTAAPGAKWQNVWSIYWAILALVMSLGGVGVLALSWSDPTSLAAQRLPFAWVYAVTCMACGGVAFWASQAATAARGRCAVSVLSVFLGLSCSGLVVNSQIRKSENAGLAVQNFKLQLPGDQALVSFGPVHHLFLFHYGRPVECTPWPATEAGVDPDLTYFCFGGEQTLTQPIPFPWEVVGVISCDRYVRPEPEQKVVIGRRLKQLPLATAPTPGKS